MTFWGDLHEACRTSLGIIFQENINKHPMEGRLKFWAGVGSQNE